jgi:phosphate transport system substrate-binding protein
MKSNIAFSFLLIVGFLFLSCGDSKKSNRNTATTGLVKIACCETLRPILEAEVDLFSATYDQADIVMSYLPESEAFDLLFKDSVSAIFATKKLTAKEIAMFNKKSLYPEQAKLAVDAIALIINHSNVDSFLTVNQIRDILRGKITKWKQINPKSKNGDIQVVFDNQKSSIVSYFVDSICGGQVDPKVLSAMKLNTDVINYVAENKNTLGFIGVSWISNRTDSLHLSFNRKVRTVAVSDSDVADSDNSFLPYQAYLVDGLYPFARDVYYIGVEPYHGLATGFSNFVASENGQRIILKSGILPALAPTRLVHVRSDF